MNFMEAVRSVLKDKYATFSGRAPRSEYWWFSLFYFLAATVLVAFGAAVFFLVGANPDNPGEPSTTALIIAGLPLIAFLFASIIPFLAVQIRRLHDRNMSAWWYVGFIVLSAVPVVGFVASIGLLVVSALKGTDGPNKFGDDPLRPRQNADVFN